MGGPKNGTDGNRSRTQEMASKQPASREWVAFAVLLVIWGIVGIGSKIWVVALGNFTEKEFIDGQNVLLLLTSLASMFGSILMVWMYAIKSQAKSEFFDMLIAMSVTDFFFASKFFLSACLTLANDNRITKDGTWLCDLASFMGQFFGLGTISWNFMISLHLSFLLSPYRDKAKKLGRFKVGLFSHCFVWVFSAVTCIAAFVDKKMGLGPQGTCWLLDEHIWSFYGPLLIYFFFALLVVMVAIRVLLRSHKGDPERIVVYQISLFTLSFILVWLWALVLRVLALFKIDIPHWLRLAQAFYLGAGGLFNFLIWLMPSIRRKRQQTQHSQSLRNVSASIEMDDKRNRKKW